MASQATFFVPVYATYCSGVEGKPDTANAGECSLLNVDCIVQVRQSSPGWLSIRQRDVSYLLYTPGDLAALHRVRIDEILAGPYDGR